MLSNSTRSLNRRHGASPKEHPGAARQHRGYVDFKEGRGFPAEYESWTEPQQRNYEIGRAAAAAAQGTLGRVPTWASNRRLSSVMRSASWTALRNVGDEISHHMRKEAA